MRFPALRAYAGEMSFGLSRGRRLDPTGVAISDEELGPLPDEILHDRDAARLDPREWFVEPSHPFEVEIGSGKGAFLLQQGEAEPGTNFLGIEYAGEFFAYAADRVRRRGLPNVRMLCTDAMEFLRWRMPSGIVRVVHLYFPDPWPKKRHHRRRMVQDAFLQECARVLVEKGELRIVTDHDEYWAWMEEHFVRWTAPRDGQPAPFVREPFDRPVSAGVGEVVGTNFERKYRREGRPFHATVLRKA